ncbi:MAG: hypothetical protein ACXVP0_17920, partial [Bacteroidia bacterium]
MAIVSKKNRLLTVLSALLFSGLGAQDTARYTPKLVYSNYAVSVEFKLKDGALMYTYENDKEITYLNNASLGNNTQSVTY